jgi:ribosomal protein S18 acetylase RimI-like enzyme
MRPGPMDDDYDAQVRAGHVVVAEADGAPAGLLVLVPHDDHLLVANVAVEPERQGQGIGRALLAYAEARAAELGLPELRLYTHVKMTENQALYARLGYREVERRAEEGFARVFMSKRIAE